MQEYGVESLTEIIDIEVLQEVQDKFAQATGLAAVIADKDGNPLTRPSCFTRFCELIRSTPGGLVKCQQSDAKLGLMASQSQKPVMAYCHAGLMDLAAPIIVNGKHLGSVLCGQVLPEKSPAKNRELAAYLFNCIGNLSDGDKLVEELPVMSTVRFEAAAGLLQIMAQYIVQIGINSLNEKLVNQKNMELMQEEASRIRLENDLKTMELKALQSQVNPHFLFNTLNTIVRLAMIEGAEETEKVSYALAHLLRYTLRRIEQEVTLQDEVKHVEEYLMIQQYRYGDRLKSEIDISEKAARLKLPILTLQPLVENAIVHGLEPKIEGGNIRIAAAEEGSIVRITVEDNGLGMTEQRLQEICHSLAAQTGRGHTTGIGFTNVIKRLSHYFGEKFSYEIHSELAKGTRILLKCPLPEEVENDV